MKKWRVVLTLVLILVGYVALEQLVETQTRGFWVQRIQAEDLGPFHAGCASPLTPEVERRLQQPYTFLGAGSECFAFLSADGETVIKFFKLDTWRPVYVKRSLWGEGYSAYAGSLVTQHPTGWLWEVWLKRLWGMREYRIQRTFASVSLAYERLQEETGVLYIHLNPGEVSPQRLTLYDACHIAHTVDLSQTRFLVQQKATALPDYLALGDEEQARKGIDALLCLLRARCDKGVADRDLEPRNFGFVQGRAVEIDTGSFSYTPGATEAERRARFVAAASVLKEPFERQFPGLASDYDRAVEAYGCDHCSP
jgi:hypothetical protein